MARRGLPFRLTRQMFSGEARESVGLVIADMLHGGGWIDGPEAAQRHDMPGSILLPPIARCLPVFVLRRCPAIGKPKRRRRVATRRNKFEPFGIRDEMPGDADARNEFVVKRRFVVETEVVTIMSDRVHAGRHVDVTAWAQRRAGSLPFRVVDRVGGGRRK